MFSLVIAFFHKINNSRRKRSESDDSATNEFRKLNLTTGVPEFNYVTDLSMSCFYLDYESSVTLSMNGKKYKNPILYCPGNTTDIKFEPENSSVYYTEIFELPSFIGYDKLKSIYIATKDGSLKVPKNKLFLGAEVFKFYADVVLTPIPNLSYTCAGSSCGRHVLFGSYLIAANYEKNSDIITIKVETSNNYTIKRNISKRYSISIPEQGPFVFAEGGLPAGAIAGIVVSVVVVVSITGVCIFYFWNKKMNHESKVNVSSK